MSPATNGTLFLLGTDRLGRDVLSRILYGARISLTIGLIGIALSFTLGLVIGAQNINVVALYPWLMLPVVPVIIVILAFNFFGDGLRDASDPYR